MSKHEKQVRRERKKTDRARRRRSLFRNPQSAVPNGAAALAAAAVIAAGTSAYADPVRYDNPPGAGHFVWEAPFGDDTNWMDITLDAASQPGAADGPTSLKFHVDVDLGRVGRYDKPIDLQTTSIYLEGVGSGTLIPSGFGWNNYGYSLYYGGTALPEGVPTYLGVRFDLGAGDHYAWIGVVRDAEHMDAFAWGYETEVGVPIPAGIPEPGSLALLAFGALAVCRRRP